MKTALRYSAILIACWLVLALVACTRLVGNSIGSGAGGSGAGDLLTGGRYDTPKRVAGSGTGVVASATGCPLRYRMYRPAAATSDGLVILAHGFLRAKEQMDGTARALARSGIATATIDFCNARPWNGRHLQNGRDMVRLARKLKADPVVYAGFSAGALAALVAGHRDPKSTGVIALDLVDQGGLGLRLAKELDIPLIALMGEPSACNAQGNGLPVVAASPRGRVETVAGAGHCDFESPTNWLCNLICGRSERAPTIRQGIIQDVVSAAETLLAAREGAARSSIRPEGTARGEES